MKFKINLYVIFLIFSFLSCRSQTISLQQMEECRKRPNRGAEGCPDLHDAKFIKDIGNRLDKFVGTWKGTANGKSYELKLEKRVDFGDSSRKLDLLLGKLKVKDSQGNILFDNFSESDADASLSGVNFQYNTYEMNFFGNDDCSEMGSVFIDILKNPTDGSKMKLFYHSTTEWVDPAKCPNYNTFVPLLPLDWMTLTKQ